MPLAARVSDNHTCPAANGPVPHGGGPILPPCSLNVVTNNLPQARVTDKAMCVGPPDVIVTGSSSVFVNGMMAARVTDKTMHGGLVALGSFNVNIGGPAAGATLGNPVAAAAACNNLAGGRTSGSIGQSYQNCGVESCRLLITKSGKNVSEDALLDQSMKHGDADDERRRADSGGTSPSERQSILARNGVATTQQTATMANIAQAVSEGRGVITSHDVKFLWGPGNSGGHAINVVGIQYDGNGNILNVITSDTGIGNCNRPVPAAQFQSSLRSGRPANVTVNPIW
jgi:uncharacterized Zn-binding protein involved in type VI secretion/phosphoribosyl-AMP cyclohydrolase